MARIFVSGSSTGLGLIAGKQLMGLGHDVILHARNDQRASDLAFELGRHPPVVIGDLSNIDGAHAVAAQVNDAGPVEAVIHNAGVGYGSARRNTVDGLPDIFAVNVLAPYILTAKIERPKRLVYLSSSMHRQPVDWADPLWERRQWNGSRAYSESKFLVTALAFAVARLWQDTCSNAVDPGWVPTRMGGSGAPDDLEAGAETQIALASGQPQTLSGVSGKYFHHMSESAADPKVRDPETQSRLLALCRDLTGVLLS